MSFFSELEAARATAEPPAPAPKYLILACDGGGIRGLFTARVIERLQAEVPFLDQVELFAGTSTGGIIALGLADGMAPADLVHLYQTRGAEIFHRTSAAPPPSRLPAWLNRLVTRVENSWEGIASFQENLGHPTYANTGLAGILTELFGARTMGDLKSGKGALVTTLRLCSSDTDAMWAPLVLHNLGPDHASAVNTRVQDQPTRGTKLVDACLATSAAPLYFPPHEHPDFGFCVDGGLYANNPASIALALALRVNEGALRHIRILSIGTGVQTCGIDIRHSPPFTHPSDYGSLAWLDPFPRGQLTRGAPLTPAFPLISALFDASSASHNYICQQALGAMYHRVQVPLPQPIDLADASPGAARSLLDAVDSIPPAAWQATTAWLREQTILPK